MWLVYDAIGDVLMPKTDLEYYFNGVVTGDRRVLSKAITLVESSHPDHQKMALALIDKLLPYSGKSVRLGITGVPGVGKSTFIESLGLYLINNAYKLAVLAVDPSSSRSKGSILGDKTRMPNLVVKNNAFVRPSPSGCTLGGVTAKTREAIILCEAAGFDVIIVETVGVGQSETAVSSMVDFFLVLMLAGAGDELQGIKKGIMELADGVAINKADGDNKKKADVARNEYENALHYLMPESQIWTPVVTTCSATENIGIDEIWATILLHNEKLNRSGELEEKRRKQVVDWMWAMVELEIKQRFYNDPEIKKKLPKIISDVESGSIAPGSALRKMFKG